MFMGLFFLRVILNPTSSSSVYKCLATEKRPPWVFVLSRKAQWKCLDLPAVVFDQIIFKITSESLYCQWKKRLKGSEFSELVFSQITGEEKSQIPRSAFEVLAKEYDEVTTEGNDFREKYQRSLAETENVRRRGIKQTEDAKVFAIQGFCKDLLEVADILEMAVNSVKAEELEKGGKTLKDLHDGVSMTRTVLLKTFTKHGLVPVNPVNEKFDPNLHEAVFQIPPANAKQQPGFVEVVTKIGFNLKDRPIRPAQVGVVAPQ
ncbi:unnamed protein product [Caenorhabditis auriculariae]|uniref:GrpE protein homolog n=1 Tax=Caenorhabditis auriculariae TaxID=2777116 RepID=A0A8S1GT05_9PELO|nr:unnamed protein product [Caenorhabditis auriculariae]